MQDEYSEVGPQDQVVTLRSAPPYTKEHPYTERYIKLRRAKPKPSSWDDYSGELTADEIEQLKREDMAELRLVSSNDGPRRALPQGAPPVLEWFTADDLRKRPVKEIEWIVQDWIVAGALNGMFGDGGVGKDLTLMQLAFAMAYGKNWLGKAVKPGRVLYFNVEDNADVLRWRQEKIEDSLSGLTLGGDNLRIIPLVGLPTILANADSRTGLVSPTPLFESVKRLIDQFKPTLTIIGNRVNIFAVNQNEDSQARQCLGFLNSLVTDLGTTIIMPSHVSVRGRKEDGTSGSVQWSNGCRQRLLLRKPDKDDDEDKDTNERILEVKKANWGPTGTTLSLRWTGGIFKAKDEGITHTPKERFEREKDEKEAAEDEFMRMLEKAEALKQNASPQPTANNYAPKLFSKNRDCKFRGKQGRAILADAMERLASKKLIKPVDYGRPSRPNWRLEKTV